MIHADARLDRHRSGSPARPHAAPMPRPRSRIGIDRQDVRPGRESSVVHPAPVEAGQHAEEKRRSRWRSAVPMMPTSSETARAVDHGARRRLGPSSSTPNGWGRRSGPSGLPTSRSRFGVLRVRPGQAEQFDDKRRRERERRRRRRWKASEGQCEPVPERKRRQKQLQRRARRQSSGPDVEESPRPPPPPGSASAAPTLMATVELPSNDAKFRPTFRHGMYRFDHRAAANLPAIRTDFIAAQAILTRMDTLFDGDSNREEGCGRAG